MTSTDLSPAFYPIDMNAPLTHNITRTSAFSQFSNDATSRVLCPDWPKPFHFDTASDIYARVISRADPITHVQTISPKRTPFESTCSLTISNTSAISSYSFALWTSEDKAKFKIVVVLQGTGITILIIFLFMIFQTA
jgi:hypothetical protein